MLLQHNSLLYLRGIYLMKIFIYLKNYTIKQKKIAFKLRSQLNWMLCLNKRYRKCFHYSRYHYLIFIIIITINVFIHRYGGGGGGEGTSLFSVNFTQPLLASTLSNTFLCNTSLLMFKLAI